MNLTIVIEIYRCIMRLRMHWRWLNTCKSVCCNSAVRAMKLPTACVAVVCRHAFEVFSCDSVMLEGGRLSDASALSKSVQSWAGAGYEGCLPPSRCGLGGDRKLAVPAWNWSPDSIQQPAFVIVYLSGHTVRQLHSGFATSKHKLWGKSWRVYRCRSVADIGLNTVWRRLFPSWSLSNKRNWTLVWLPHFLDSKTFFHILKFV
jgi:hypothetical protein